MAQTVELKPMGGSQAAQPPQPRAAQRDQDTPIKKIDLVRALKRRRRHQYYRGLFHFSWYLGLLVFVAVQQQAVHDAFEQAFAVTDLFQGEEFPLELVDGALEGPQYLKTFDDIATLGELWDWCFGPLAGGLYEGEWYNGDEMEPAEQFVIAGQNMLLGGVEIRQHRVREGTCALDDDDLEQYVAACYGAFSEEHQQTSAFGPADALLGWDASAGEFRTGRYAARELGSELLGKVGYGPGGTGRTNYGYEGYAVELPLDADAGEAILEDLFANRWTDAGTRAVAVTFNVYNPATKLGMSVRFTVEFFKSGNVEKSRVALPIKLNVYRSTIDKVRLVMELLLMVKVLQSLVETAVGLMRSADGLTFLLSPWQLLDLCYTGSLLTMATMWVMYVGFRANVFNFDEEVLARSDEYVDIFDDAQAYSVMGDVTALTVLLGFLQIFKYCRFSKRSTVLWDTLQKSAPDLVSLVMAFVLLNMGFSLLGYLAFGARIREYHNVGSAVATLNLLAIGDFDYQTMVDEAPTLGPMFFTAWTFIVAFALLNFFIAVISKYYEVVEDIGKREAQLTGDAGTELVLRPLERVQHALGFFDLLREGCELLSEQRRQTKAAEGAHAGFCLASPRAFWRWLRSRELVLWAVQALTRRYALRRLILVKRREHKSAASLKLAPIAFDALLRNSGDIEVNVLAMQEYLDALLQKAELQVRADEVFSQANHELRYFAHALRTSHCPCGAESFDRPYEQARAHIRDCARSIERVAWWRRWWVRMHGQCSGELKNERLEPLYDSVMKWWEELNETADDDELDERRLEPLSRVELELLLGPEHADEIVDVHRQIADLDALLEGTAAAAYDQTAVKEIQGQLHEKVKKKRKVYRLVRHRDEPAAVSSSGSSGSGSSGDASSGSGSGSSGDPASASGDGSSGDPASASGDGSSGDPASASGDSSSRDGSGDPPEAGGPPAAAAQPPPAPGTP